jgi:hypothetical protein
MNKKQRRREKKRMATEQVTFDTLYKRLLAAFGPHKDAELEAMRKAEYEKALEDIPLEVLSMIVDSAVKGSPKFPTIGQIRQIVERGMRPPEQAQVEAEAVIEKTWEEMVQKLTPEQLEALRDEAFKEMDLVNAQSLGQETCDMLLHMRMIAKYKGLV